MTECFRMHNDPIGVLNNEGTPSRKTYVDTRRPARTTSTVALFSGVYVATVTCAAMPIGLLAFAMRDNFDRAVREMSMDKRSLRRLMYRLRDSPFV